MHIIESGHLFQNWNAMNGQPIKRRHLNPFVDLEAVREGEESDEETELAEGALSKFAPMHVLIMPDVFQDNVSQDEVDLDISFLALQNAMQEAQHVDQWDCLILSGGGHSVGLAFEDAVLIARLIKHLKLNNIHEVPAFYGTSSTID